MPVGTRAVTISVNTTARTWWGEACFVHAGPATSPERQKNTPVKVKVLIHLKTSIFVSIFLKSAHAFSVFCSFLLPLKQMSMSVRCMAHVLRSAKTQKAVTSVFALKVFFLLVSRMGQSVLPRVRAHHSHTGEMFFENILCIKLPRHSIRLNFCVGNPPVLLLPDNVRIRRFNLSSEQYSDYVDNAEHIQALDYLWDPEGQGLSKISTFLWKLQWIYKVRRSKLEHLSPDVL